LISSSDGNSSDSNNSDNDSSNSSDNDDDDQNAAEKEHRQWVKAQLKKIQNDNKDALVGINNNITKKSTSHVDIDFAKGENNDLVIEQARIEARQALDNTHMNSDKHKENGTMWKSMKLFSANTSFLQR